MARAHIERASYWPDPAPDCSISPCAGGQVPTARSLESAVAAGAVSHAYLSHCPNDQTLIAVLGRQPGSSPPPQPPLSDRHGIPDLGPYIRCNLQMEGSGVAPDDVTIDAGRVASGDGAPIEAA